MTTWMPRSLAAALVLATVLVATAVPGAAQPPSPATTTANSGLLLTAEPNTGPAPLFVSFSVTPPNGTSPAWSWSFGDGGFWNGTGPNYTTVVHDYDHSGTFVAVVTATWSSGSLRANETIDVTPANLNVIINATPSTGTIPFTVNFEARPSGGSGTYVSFLWNFGDGSVGSGASVRYTYLHPGTFSVVVALTDSGHRTASGTTTVRATSTGGQVLLPGSGTSGGPTFLGLPLASVLAAGAAGAGLAILAVSLVRIWQSRRRRSASSPASSAPIDGSGVPAPTPPSPTAAPTAGGTVLELAANLGSPLPAVGIPSMEGPPGPVRTGAGWNAPTRRAAPSAPTTSTNRQLASLLLRRLQSLPRTSPGELPTLDWTQAGLAQSLGVGQSAVSKVLRRLSVGGVVVAETSHVRGSARRVRVYRLTARGEQLARALRETDGTRSGPDRGR